MIKMEKKLQEFEALAKFQYEEARKIHLQYQKDKEFEIDLVNLMRVFDSLLENFIEKEVEESKKLETKYKQVKSHYRREEVVYEIKEKSKIISRMREIVATEREKFFIL